MRFALWPKQDRPAAGIPDGGRESVDMRVLRAVLDLPHQIGDQLAQRAMHVRWARSASVKDSGSR